MELKEKLEILMDVAQEAQRVVDSLPSHNQSNIFWETFRIIEQDKVKKMNEGKYAEAKKRTEGRREAIDALNKAFGNDEFGMNTYFGDSIRDL